MLSIYMEFQVKNTAFNQKNAANLFQHNVFMYVDMFSRAFSTGVAQCRPLQVIPAIPEVVSLHSWTVPPEKLLLIFSIMMYVYGGRQIEYLCTV